MEAVEQKQCLETDSAMQAERSYPDSTPEAQNFMEMYTGSKVRITFDLINGWLSEIIRKAYSRGYKYGYEDGFVVGNDHVSKMYDTGYAEGHRIGYKDGYSQGSKINNIESLAYPTTNFQLGLQTCSGKTQTDTEIAKNVLAMLKTSMSEYGKALSQSEQSAAKYLPESVQYGQFSNNLATYAAEACTAPSCESDCQAYCESQSKNA